MSLCLDKRPRIKTCAGYRGGVFIKIRAPNDFKPCGGQDQSSFGWVPPIGEQGEEYVHACNGYLMICGQRQERVLPAAVVNEALAEKVRELQQGEGRPVGRKERMDIKEELVFELLPRAFTRSQRQFAYIAPQQGLLVIDAASANKADALQSFLRETLGSLPVIPLIAKNLPQHVMTAALKGEQSLEGFELGHECELRSKLDENAVIRCKYQDLAADEIGNHIDAGMFVTKLGLQWREGIECLVDDKLAVKRLKFADRIVEKSEETHADTAAEQFDADFAVMSLELSSFIDELLAAFGGEDLSQAEPEL
jgi:recombination associated protein RdgC